jgi:hypothetical protein
MNKIQLAMQKKVNGALGEIEYQIDCFMDNGYKTKFDMVKYLTSLEYKRKLVELMRNEWDGLIDELESTEEDFIEAYSHMTTAEKKRFLKFLRGLGKGCDDYIALNENEWAQDTAAKRLRNKSRKANQKRIEEISQGTGYARKKSKRA